jgi:hypothetical protein
MPRTTLAAIKFTVFAPNLPDMHTNRTGVIADSSPAFPLPIRAPDTSLST